MPDKTETAAPSGPIVLTGATLITERRGTKTLPALQYDGKAPNKGDTVQVKIGNGVTYEGLVSSTSDGVVHLRDGLTPIT